MKTADLFRKTLLAFFEKKITTQSRLADELGIHRVNMNKFVKERVGFSEERKELISKHFGFTYAGMLELGRRLMSHEPFYWAMREVWLDEDMREHLLEKLGLKERAVFNPLRKMLFKESMKASVVEALGTTLDEMVERGKVIMITEPGLQWDLNDSFHQAPASSHVPWKNDLNEWTTGEDVPGVLIFERLKESRHRLGFTQAQIAKELKVGLSRYQRYERGQRDIPASVLVSMVNLGIDPTWLLTGSSVEPPKKIVGYDDVVEQNFDIVRQFKNHEDAKEINQDLLILERLSEKDFFKAAAYIKGLLDGCKDKIDEPK